MIGGLFSGGSILPWNNWIYHVDDKQKDLKDLHTQALNLQDSIRKGV